MNAINTPSGPTGPRPFFRAALASLAVTSGLAMAIAAGIRPPGSLPGTQRHILADALVALCLSALAGLGSLIAGRLRRVSRPNRWLDHPVVDSTVPPRERAALWLALAIWFPFLLIIVYYRAKATFPPPVHYVYFRYDDKRWVSASYLLGVLAPAIWLTTAARVLAIGRGQPPTWRAWLTRLLPGQA